MIGAACAAAQLAAQTTPVRPKAPLVVAVGCAEATSAPHLWRLSRASAPAETTRAGITTAEKPGLGTQPLGGRAYELIGVAEFVDVETARRIGVRGEILSAGRVNATGSLSPGRKVAVKGLYIEGTSPHINLTSVADLGDGCEQDHKNAAHPPERSPKGASWSSWRPRVVQAFQPVDRASRSPDGLRDRSFATLHPVDREAPAVSHATAVTFNQDVAAILLRRCVTCHRAGAGAPMSLMTYDDVRPWARAIKTRVVSREMPPWFADPRFGLELANDPRLSDAEIATIVAWVDAGAPRGTGDPPQSPVFATGWYQFNGRPPDAIVEMAGEIEIPSEGAMPVFTVWSPNPFTEDKFIEAVQLRPSAVGAVHHSDVTARALPRGTTLGRGAAWTGGPAVDFVPVFPDGRSYNELNDASDPSHHTAANDVFRTSDDYRLLFYVPGGGLQEFPPGTVKRISAGNMLAWNLHYTATGRPEIDRHQLGLWFARTPPMHEAITKRIGEAHVIEGREFVAESDEAEFPTIPPHAADWKITAITPFQDDVTIYTVWPHMHLRGKDMTFIATLPDGREKVVLHVPRYDFQWQLQYELAAPLHLPAGSTIKAIGHYDNSSGNRKNPRPDVPVRWSEQSWDEMFNGWMELSVDRDVITAPAVYTLATPVHDRASLGLSSGPPGTVYIVNPDGSIAASGRIGSAPSLIEPWTFIKGQTVRIERGGPDIWNVTVTFFDVPPDVTGTIAIDGPAVPVTTTQPGQNAALTLQGAASQQLNVHVFGNRIGTVVVKVIAPDGVTVLGSSTSSSGTFNLPSVTLPSSGTYTIVIDPSGLNTGMLYVALTSRGGVGKVRPI